MSDDMNTPDPKHLLDADRRDFVRKAGAVAVSTLAAPYVWAQRTDETLVVNSFGGEYQEVIEKAVIQPFEKKFGVKVVHDAAELQRAVEDVLASPEQAAAMGRRAQDVVRREQGATARNAEVILAHLRK